jgi:hypothetical protein
VTEREWWTADDPRMMAGARVEWLYYNARATHRKLRLFCVACLHRLARERPFWLFAKYIPLLEAFADGEFDQEGLESRLDPLDDALLFPGPLSPHIMRSPGEYDREDWLLSLCATQDENRERTNDVSCYPTIVSLHSATFSSRDFISELRVRVALLHDIFGPLPFREIACDPAWLTDTVRALARGIYEQKAFERMPILADALQDAGCENEDILNHCRDTACDHVRGCWVLDLLLGHPGREE